MSQHVHFSPHQLKSRRKAAGLSRTKLGAALDVSENTVADWELGRWVPRANTLAALALEFGCAMEELFTYANDDDPPEAGRRMRVSCETKTPGKAHGAA